MLQTPPQTPPPAPVTANANVLASDPLEIARQQFIAFATGTIQQSWYTQPPTPAEIARARRELLAAGRMKEIHLIARPETRYGAGYAFRFVCEHGSVIEQYTIKDGKITGVEFKPAK